MIITDIRDAINKHIAYVSLLHRLRFSEASDAASTIYICLCGYAGDRSSWNDHIDEMYQVAAIERPAIKFSETAQIEKHRGRTK